jgi:two-component system, NarL family, response regulator LiaR
MNAEESLRKDTKIRLILADDHPLLRQALRNVLERYPDFEIVGEASNGEEVIELVTKLVPDVVILDINMPVINGIEATRRIKASHPDVAVLVLTVYDDIPHILGVIEAGAAGYLTKDVFGEDIVNAIRGVVAGETVLVPSISRQIVQYVLTHKTKTPPVSPFQDITKRELEVLRLASIGKSNKEIAEELNITARTVKAHLAEIFSKLNAGSRIEAVVKALKLGIISLDNIDSFKY